MKISKGGTVKNIKAKSHALITDSVMSLKKLIDFTAIMIAIFCCLYLPIEQLFIWLKTGQHVKRNFFWVFGETETLISSPYIHVTDWIGLNNIINYFFNIHLGVIAFLLGWIWLSIRLKDHNQP